MKHILSLFLALFACSGMYAQHIIRLSIKNSEEKTPLAGATVIISPLNKTVIAEDEKNKTDLITNGLFGFSRNPIFLGMILSTIGIFLIMPDTITFFIAATSYIVIQIQIRLEEEHLVKQHGTIYSEYKRTVRRLI